MATASTNVTMTSNNSGRQTLVAANTLKKYTVSQITVSAFNLKNTASKNSNTVTIQVGFTDWTNNYSVTTVATKTLTASQTFSGTIASVYQTITGTPNRAIYFTVRGDYTLNGRVDITITYTEYAHPTVSAGTTITAAQITTLNTWKTTNAVNNVSQGRVIYNSDVAITKPGQGTSVTASWYNNA